MPAASKTLPKAKRFQKVRIDHVDLWTSQGVEADCRVWLENGRVKKIASANQPVPDATGPLEDLVYDGRGLVLMPAGVDAQAHLRVPGQAQKEPAATGLLSALKGGYSAVLTMPNTSPTIDNVEVLERGRAETEPIESELGVRVLWSAAITKKLNSSDLTDFHSLVQAGVKAFTNDGLGVESDEVMAGAFKMLETASVPLLQHAEFLGHQGSLAPGPVQEKVGARPYPAEAEWKMVERDLRVLKNYPKARYHVLHVSSAKTLELVAEAKKQGLKVTCEASPHHLYFNTETLKADNTAFKMNPPIRDKADQQALWQGLRTGLVDFVATDHAPHETAMKTGAFDQVAFGTLGFETTLLVLLKAWRDGELTPEQLVQVWATRPARFLGLEADYADLTEGSMVHGILVNPNSPDKKLEADSLSTVSQNSCFIGQTFQGRIVAAVHEDRWFQFS